MLSGMMARGRAWLSRIQSRRKRGHGRRQDAAVRRNGTLCEIVGADAGETFARRVGYLRKLDPLVFEEMVLDAFQCKGWIVERNSHYTGDGGLDGKVYRDNHWIGIQCKRYKGAIQSAHVDLFARDLHKFGLSEGYFVHTGRTPAGTRHRQGNVIILSGRELMEFLL
ncbi:restriction endonuclease [Acidithiobacillus ferriphilus]|uniref:restriction endonuclease n=1 Tax=Acidithiobacillus ferriphilus TaxID=1689834 RepID=UPI001C0682FF|nr:restriction endonuclease [Acidithiobacillus ferriphilus]MBU2852939.1 restriction endonuclease [Acidithiobacillus ferriphilus]